MRIGFIAQPEDTLYLPLSHGGSLALWIYYMARECAKRGHECIILANDGSISQIQDLIRDGVRYIFAPTVLDRAANKLVRLLNKFGLVSARVPLFASKWHHRIYIERLAREIRRLDCDVVHILNYSQFVPVVRAISPRSRISLHMQCEWLSQLDRREIADRLRSANVVIGCSDYITRTITDRFPEFADRCFTVPNAAAEVDLESEPNRKSQDILFVNRLSPEKGVHDLIRAFRLVLPRFPEARLWIVGGSGRTPFEYVVGLTTDERVVALRPFYKMTGGGGRDPYLQYLEREAGSELAQRILFLGHVAHDEIGTHYRRAAVLVSASIWNEPFGISLIEAMMHGVPVVATRMGGMVEIVDDGKTGLLVEPCEPYSLAEAICKLLADESRARKLGENGRQKAIGKYSWSRAADRLLGVFNSMFEPSDAPARSGSERETVPH